MALNDETNPRALLRSLGFVIDSAHAQNDFHLQVAQVIQMQKPSSGLRSSSQGIEIQSFVEVLNGKMSQKIN